jgi:hypothetical protein
MKKAVISSDELLYLLKDRFGGGSVRVFSGGNGRFSVEDPLWGEKYDALSLESKKL